MLSSFQDLFQSLFHTIFNPDVSPVELMGLVLFLALVWALIFTLAAVILHPLVYKKPWLVAAGERDYERGGKELNEALGIDVTKEEHIELFMSTWPWIQCVCLQHFVGGCLTVPAVFHLMPDNQETAASLACLGILSEMAWELSDMVTWIYKRYFVKGGKEKVPASVSPSAAREDSHHQSLLLDVLVYLIRRFLFLPQSWSCYWLFITA
jgi:hypothetical protein